MGAPYNNIDLRLEAACEELLTESSNFSAITIATGLNDGTREEDCVIAWEADCNISIYTNADATSALATHRTRTANMRDLFMDDGIETSLTGTDESILVSSVHNYSTAQSVEERFFISSLSFTAILSAT